MSGSATVLDLARSDVGCKEDTAPYLASGQCLSDNRSALQQDRGQFKIAPVPVCGRAVRRRRSPAQRRDHDRRVVVDSLLVNDDCFGSSDEGQLGAENDDDSAGGGGIRRDTESDAAVGGTGHSSSGDIRLGAGGYNLQRDADSDNFHRFRDDYCFFRRGEMD